MLGLIFAAALASQSGPITVPNRPSMLEVWTRAPDGCNWISPDHSTMTAIGCEPATLLAPIYRPVQTPGHMRASDLTFISSQPLPPSLANYTAPDGRTAQQLIDAHVLPDPRDNPGVLNLGVSPANIRATICTHGWTATVRPPTSVTNTLKAKLLPAGHKLLDYELDHLLSIEDGGSPSDPRNLWMMVYADHYGARVKDVLETRVAHMVCKGQLTLDQARAALAPNWLAGYVQYVGPLP